MDFIKEAISQNGHWQGGSIAFPRVGGLLIERTVLAKARLSAATKFVTILRGLRRTGKSVLARQLALERLAKARDAHEVAWFEFDRGMNATADDLDALLTFFQSQGGRLMVLDEVPFVPMWQDVLKRHYDRTDEKFIATGSSAIELDRRSSESLAGRFDTIDITPFSLKERMLLEGKKTPETALERARRGPEMLTECGDYLQAGGLPEITTGKDAEERGKYVSQSFLDPLFYKDFPAVFPNANPDLLRKTLELLSATTGSTFQLQAIAEALGCSHTTAGTQVEMLEKTLLTRTIYNATPSIAKQKRTAKKIAFADTGILKALNPEATLGQLAENAALQTLGAKHFWRDAQGHEVDIVLPKEKLAVEVKYQNNISTRDEKNLRYFLEKRKGWRGVLVTKNEEDAKTDVKRIPLWKVLLNPNEAFPQ